MRIFSWRREFYRDEEGASVVEYGVLIALIAAVLILLIIALGLNVEQAFRGFYESFISLLS